MGNVDLIDKIKICGTSAGICFTWLLGEWETGLQILLTCMAIDYVLGLLWGFKSKNLDSRIAYKGLRKKFSVLLILMLATQFDKLNGNGWIFRTATIYFYVSMEGLSILETCAKFGVPIPAKLKDALVQLQETKEQEQKGENQ